MEAEQESDLENLKSMMERMTNVNQAKTDAKLKDLTEMIEKTQMELQTAEVSLDARTRKLQEDATQLSPGLLLRYGS
jgi:DNA repair ATPase RecN